jgi:hypothetical protein
MTDRIRKILAGFAILAALALGGAALAGAAPGGGTDTTGDDQSEASEPAEGTEREHSATDPDSVQEANGKDDADEGSEKGGDDESDERVTGDAATRARQAAVAEIGGKAGDVERDSEKGGAYEVEVTKPAGREADVYLDDRFKVVAVDEGSEQADDDEQDGDS